LGCDATYTRKPAGAAALERVRNLSRRASNGKGLTPAVRDMPAPS